MRTVKFHKTECGVDFLLNVLPAEQVREGYLKGEVHNTDYFEIVFFKKGRGYVILNHQRVDIVDNTVVFISEFKNASGSSKRIV